MRAADVWFGGKKASLSKSPFFFEPPASAFPSRFAKMSTSAAAAPQEQGFFSSLLSSVFTTYVIPLRPFRLVRSPSETRISSLVVFALTLPNRLAAFVLLDYYSAHAEEEEDNDKEVAESTDDAEPQEEEEEEEEPEDVSLAFPLSYALL
jgi:hypothetical protein